MKTVKIFSSGLIVLSLVIISAIAVPGVHANTISHDQIAQSLKCVNITNEQGWVWSASCPDGGATFMPISGEHLSISIVTGPKDSRFYPQHSEAYLIISQVRGPGTITIDRVGSEQIYCIVVDPSGNVVDNKIWINCFDDFSVSIPGDGKYYKVIWIFTSDYQGYSDMKISFHTLMNVQWQPGTVNPVNQAPVAYAGTDQAVYPGIPVVLNGRSSYDPDRNLPLSYSWSVTGSPAGSSPVFSDPSSIQPVFTTDIKGVYTIQLVVRDSAGASSEPASVRVTVNTPPIITNTTAAVQAIKKPVALQGSAYDPDNDPLTYTWKLTARPTMSRVVLGALSTSKDGKASFTPDTGGIFTAQFTASDGKASVTSYDVMVFIDPDSIQSSGPSNEQPDRTGSIYVYTNPSGATIIIDNIERGQSSMMVPNVMAGTRNLTLTKPGYQAKTIFVDVPAGGVKILPLTELISI